MRIPYQKHLIFYDGSCGFCHRAVRFLLHRDAEGLFLFAPLQGKTAAEFLPQWPSAVLELETLVLWEKDQELLLFYGKAVFRIFWLLGGKWKLFGFFYFLPAFFYDWAYRLFAKYRKKIFPIEGCEWSFNQYDNRFLP